jgi:LPS-assembly lipoprotein
MWWPELRPTVLRRPACGAVRFAARGAFATRGAMRFATRGAVLFALGGLLAGCFEPMYAQKTLTGGPGLQQRFASIGIVPISASTGTLGARVAVEVQNALAYEFTGGGGPVGKAYDLKITLTSQVQQVIVDITTARPDMQQFGLNASYTLTEVATGKVVVTGSAFSRVSFDNPGQQQRFANARGQRDAETRAAKVIADSIKGRLASYFVAGA